MRLKFRSYTDEALSALVKALKQPRYRVAAAVAILAYGWGRPVATTDVAKADASEDSTTFVIKPVAPNLSSVNGSNGALASSQSHSPPKITTVAVIPEAFSGLMEPHRYLILAL